MNQYEVDAEFPIEIGISAPFSIYVTTNVVDAFQILCEKNKLLNRGCLANSQLN